MTQRRKLRRFLRPFAKRFVQAQPETKEWAAVMQEWIATVQEDAMPASIEESSEALLDVIIELAGKERAGELWSAVCVDIDRYILSNHAAQGRA